jgi:exopolysaccharide biosynthesis predicted pyruvyltransferase EpsI
LDFILLDVDGHNRDVEQLTQNIQRDESNKDRYKRAFTNLRKIQKAEHVWTQRLHIALPCKAFETPYTLVPAPHEEQRYSALDIEEDILGLACKFLEVREEPRTLDQVEKIMVSMVE